jgi:hypothetical protein
MKSIETFYKNNFFRSRLEARWAYFFEHMQIKYEYEQEGFVLDDGSWYLPDFWLPESKMYFEVKPEVLLKEELNKCIELAKDEPVILGIGLPKPISYQYIEWSYDKYVVDVDPYSFEDKPVAWEYGYLFLFYHNYEPGNFEYAPGPMEKKLTYLEAACIGAQKARFEHGENK